MAEPTTVNGNTELIEFLQGHFTSIDQAFVKIDDRFTSIDEQFAHVDEQFVRIGERFTDIDEQFADVRQEMREGFRKMNERIDGLYTLIDSFVKLHQKLDIELTALRDKYNRLARAHNELAVRVARIEGAPA